MASWTDGAAYAPINRPDGFATPEVEPLELATAPVTTTPGPIPAPQEFRQDAPVTSVGEVRTTEPSSRNPSEPFLVSGGLMTTASSMGHADVRDPRSPFFVRRDGEVSIAADALPPPTGAPLALPFAGPPGPDGGQLDALMSTGMMSSPGARRITPAEMGTQKLLIYLVVACCVLGFTFGSAAPVLLILAGSLSLRATVLAGRIGISAIVAGLLLIMTGFIVLPGTEELYGRLLSFVFGLWFAIAAAVRYRSRS